MAKLVILHLETNDFNEHGVAHTAYYDGKPTDAQIKQDAANATDLPLTVDVNDPFYQAIESPNKLSRSKGLYRYQIFPGG